MIGYKEEAGWVREGLEDGGVCLYAGVETCAVRKFPLNCFSGYLGSTFGRRADCSFLSGRKKAGANAGSLWM